MWAGDKNADYSRNTQHCRIVKESVEEMRMVSAWDTFKVDFTRTYEREGVSRTSILDHFHFSERILPAMMEAGVIHHPDNNSDHKPIYSVLEYITISKSSTQPSLHKPRPSWRLAGQKEKEKYKLKIDSDLSTIVTPTQLSDCHDPHCKEEEHLEAIDWFATKMLEAV